MEFKDIFRYIVAIGGSLVTYLFGGWSTVIQILVAFVVIDYVTGVLAAAISGKLNSNIGLKGIAKKVGVFVIVAVANLVDKALGDAHVFRDATIFFYLANELLSVIENVGRFGLPMPEVLQKAIEVLKGKGEINK